jgi:hypothetical protein
MKNILASLQKLFLYLILVLIGLYAGMLFNHKICPVETQLNPIEYAKYWKIVDGTFMHERMGIMGPGMGIVFALTILLFLKNWRSLTFLFLVLSFIPFAIDISFTLREQLPINAYINQLDLAHITIEKTKQLTEFQAKAISNFDTRFIHSTISFLLLCLCPFFLSRINKENTL